MGEETSWLDQASGLPNEPPGLPNQAERTPERIICIFVLLRGGTSSNEVEKTL